MGVAAPQHSALDMTVFFVVASIKAQVGGNIYTNSLLSFCVAELVYRDVGRGVMVGTTVIFIVDI